MKTLEQTLSLIEDLNEQSHNDAWDHWVYADEEEDEEAAEDLRELASDVQAGCPYERLYELNDEDFDSIVYWIKNNDDVRDQLQDWLKEDLFEMFLTSRDKDESV